MGRTWGRRIGLGLLLAVSLSGCWPQIGNGPGNQRVNGVEEQLTRENVGSLAEDWRTDVNASLSEPIVWGSRVYATSFRYGSSFETVDDMAVRAFDLDSGQMVWERSLLPAGAAVNGYVEPVVLVDGALWVAYWLDDMPACTGQLLRLDPADGAILSSLPTGRMSNILVMAGSSSIVASGSRFAYTSATCSGVQLDVRDVASQASLWTYSFPAGSGTGTPTIAGGKVFVNAGHTLYAFDANGCGASVCSPVWTQDLGGTLVPDRPVAGPGGQVFVVAVQSGPAGPKRTVVAVDATDGAVLWQTELRYSGTSGLAVTGDLLYVAGSLGDSFGDAQATIDAYAAAGCAPPVCSPTWSAPVGPTRTTTAPTVAGGVAYVAVAADSSTAPAVVAVDAAGCGAATCAELRRVPLVSGGGQFIVNANPYSTSVAGGHVFVAWTPNISIFPDALIALAPTT